VRDQVLDGDRAQTLVCLRADQTAPRVGEYGVTPHVAQNTVEGEVRFTVAPHAILGTPSVNV